MKKAYENTQTRQKTRQTAAIVAPTVGERISQSVVLGFFGVSALIGIWSFAAVIGGLVTAGPTAMARGFVTAILGI